jgi:hypothetical protein
VSVVAIAVVAVLGLPISNNQAATPEPPPGGVYPSESHGRRAGHRGCDK